MAEIFEDIEIKKSPTKKKGKKRGRKRQWCLLVRKFALEKAEYKIINKKSSDTLKFIHSDILYSIQTETCSKGSKKGVITKCIIRVIGDKAIKRLLNDKKEYNTAKPITINKLKVLYEQLYHEKNTNKESDGK